MDIEVDRSREKGWKSDYYIKIFFIQPLLLRMLMKVC